ncbi:MAG: bifunctional tetrahydrofolate synthase/dihydrofolate synthase [Gammaproteobacteria bacterium]
MNENWTVDEWLDFLEHRHKQTIHLRLENPKLVANTLNILNWSIPVITVAGTNGKGSTVATLSAIYQAGGYRVGQFTSPHLFRFNERICINQNPISNAHLCDLFQRVEIARGETALTYFEVSLLVALLYFKDQGIDVLILEVGMGGRLDATNIISANLAIITTIDLDHQTFLGPDREAIGKEKAGILRKDQPFIYADYDPPASIVDCAENLKTQTYRLGEEYSYEISCHSHEGGNPSIKLEWHLNCEGIPAFSGMTRVLPLPNIHPKAAAAAIMASLCLQSVLPLSPEDLATAMQTVQITGRQQWVTNEISFVYDVAHNPQAAHALAQCIENRRPEGQIHAVFSALQDKDICGLIRPLSSIVEQWYPTLLSSPRASSSEQLLTAFNTELNLQPQCFQDPIQATQAAIAAAKPGDLILVYGSFVLVGAVMAVYM